MRYLVRFFVLGALLCLAKRGLVQAPAQGELPTLKVVVKDSASNAELERAIDEAVLVEQAIASAGALLDPVVREQLLRDMRVRAPADEQHDEHSETDAALLQRAIALGLHHADPVARQRLMFQAEQLLMARAGSAQVDEAELAHYLREHSERYAVPAQFTFTHVFLSRTRHRDALQRDAAALLQRLERESLGPHAALALGDPSMLPRTFEQSPATVLDARFGPGFANALAGLPTATWSGPIASAYGLHLLWVDAQRPAHLPTLAEVYPRVLADYRHDQRQSVLRARLRSLRAGYRLDVRRLRV